MRNSTFAKSEHHIPLRPIVPSFLTMDMLVTLLDHLYKALKLVTEM